MANDITQYVAGSVRRMPAGRRIMALGGVVGVIAAVIGVGMWASEPAWVVMYQDVGLADAGQMADVLDKAAIPNKLGGDGSTVMVGRDDHARARVALARAQLPRSGRPGWELFDGNASWGMTEFTQRITYQRALEGELARSISATAGVDRAEVHLTMPEPGALRRADRPAKAAVLLRMRPGMVLASGAVQGIVATVAASVDRLSPEQIAVTDDSGRLLTGGGDDSGIAGGLTRRMEIQQSVEDYLATKAERLLRSVSGFGAPRVQIAAQLNFDQVERTIESYDPETQVLQSEGRSETEGSAEGGGAQTIINNTYQNSRKLERIVSGGAGVTRLTVAVLIDERSLNADSAATTPVPARLANIETVVKNAIGFDSTRGDRITVTAVPFEVVALDTTRQEPPTDVIGMVERLMRPAVGLVGIIVLLLVALRAMKGLAPVGGGGASMTNGASTVAPLTPEIAPLGPPPETVLLKKQVVQETAEKPELMAQVVRAWMGEGAA